MTLMLIITVTLFLSLAMMLAFRVQQRTRNAGWVDAVWTFALGLAGVTYALAASRHGAAPRAPLVGLLVAAWSLRLGLYIVGRTREGVEDSRYAQFRRDWGEAFDRRMFLFLQIQAAAAAFLALSMGLAASNPAPLGARDALAGMVLGASVIGAGLADAQLGRFRADPANRGRVCDRGLWARSRHPNYFFEWLGWCAYPLFAIAPVHPLGWLALSGPVCMYWLLVHVSGIPPLEAQMLRSRGDAYRAYQAATPAFFPSLFRKSR